MPPPTRNDNRAPLKDKVCLITGSSSGIGLATAEALAEMGAQVIIHGRKAMRTMRAFRHLMKKGYDVSFVLCDFSSLIDLNALVEHLQECHPRIDILINNAGMINSSFAQSDEGFEMQFAVNHLAPFFLTNTLLHRGILSVGARVINVSSDAHYRVKILDLDNLQRAENFHYFKTYCRTKLCNVLFTNELARRFDSQRCTFTALHPGEIATGIGSKHTRAIGLAWKLIKPFLKSVDKGAETSIHLASLAKIEQVNGQYFANCSPKRPSELSLDTKLATELWNYTTNCIQAHLNYPLG